MIYGYARCSTTETRQDIGRQKRDLKELGVEDDRYIFWEYASGIKADRPELMKLLEIVKSGDTVVATEVSRLSRSTSDLCDLLKVVQSKHLCLAIGSFQVDCRGDMIDPATKGMLLMWSVFAELERDIISQRVRSGMLNAKLKGKRIGRPKIDISRSPPSFFQYLSLYRVGKITVTGFAKLVGCSRTSIYAYLKVLESSTK